MQTIGEEQKIQTLFRELRLENERVAPGFAVIWNSAQTKMRPRLTFRLSFVAVTAVLALGLLSFALWLRDRPRNPHQVTAVVISSVSPTFSPSPRALKSEPNQVVTLRARYRANATGRVLRLAERRRVRMLALRTLREAEMRTAVAISSWQSPTAMLMQSPVEDVLTSPPQLYRSVTDLNSFLPDTQE